MESRFWFWEINSSCSFFWLKLPWSQHHSIHRSFREILRSSIFFFFSFMSFSSHSPSCNFNSLEFKSVFSSCKCYTPNIAKACFKSFYFEFRLSLRYSTLISIYLSRASSSSSSFIHKDLESISVFASLMIPSLLTISASMSASSFFLLRIIS